MDIHVRDACKDDIPDILSIWDSYMSLLHGTNPDYWNLQNGISAFASYLMNSFEKSEVLLIVAEDSQKTVVGFTLAHMERLPEWFGAKPIGFIRYIAVAEEFRHQGVGKEMTLQTVAWFKDAGIRRVELFVLKGLESINFWEKMGFESFMDRRFLELQDQ